MNTTAQANPADMNPQALACAARARRFATLVGQAYSGPTTAQQDAAFSRAWKGAFDTVGELPPVRRDVHRNAQRAERVIAWIAAAVVVFGVGVLAGRGW